MLLRTLFLASCWAGCIATVVTAVFFHYIFTPVFAVIAIMALGGAQITGQTMTQATAMQRDTLRLMRLIEVVPCQK